MVYFDLARCQRETVPGDTVAKEVTAMTLKRRLAGLAMVAALAIGGGGGACEQRVREADAGDPRPAETKPSAASLAPAQPADATAADAVPAALPEPKPAEPPRPVLSFLMIDGLGAQFPSTKLVLHEGTGGKRRAELFSDLPKSALAHYEGNELYLEMDLAAGGGPQKVDGATWRYRSAGSDKDDSANGIFLDGQRRHLQPMDVLVKFERQGDQLMAQVMGQFRAYEPGTPDALAPFVGVRGAMPVEIVEKR